MSKTGVFKRCSCTEPVVDADGHPTLGPDGKPKRRELGAGCTRLADGRHGTWWFQLDLPASVGIGGSGCAAAGNPAGVRRRTGSTRYAGCCRSPSPTTKRRGSGSWS